MYMDMHDSLYMDQVVYQYKNILPVARTNGVFLEYLPICPINQRSKLGFTFGLTSTDASRYMFMLMTEHSSIVVRIFKLPETKFEIHHQLTEG